MTGGDRAFAAFSQPANRRMHPEFDAGSDAHGALATAPRTKQVIHRNRSKSDTDIATSFDIGCAPRHTEASPIAEALRCTANSAPALLLSDVKSGVRVLQPGNTRYPAARGLGIDSWMSSATNAMTATSLCKGRRRAG